jgi:hypothetical protein
MEATHKKKFAFGIISIALIIVLISIGLYLYLSDQKLQRDGNFIAYDNGVILDKNTDLEWVAGPDRNTTWHEARTWVQKLTVDGGGWRMPTRKELKTLCRMRAGPCDMTPLLKTTGSWVWSGETKFSSAAWGLQIIWGKEDFRLQTLSDHFRVFAVRSRRR